MSTREKKYHVCPRDDVRGLTFTHFLADLGPAREKALKRLISQIEYGDFDLHAHGIPVVNAIAHPVVAAYWDSQEMAQIAAAVGNLGWALVARARSQAWPIGGAFMVLFCFQMPRRGSNIIIVEPGWIRLEQLRRRRN